jgi:hypothetical protein
LVIGAKEGVVEAMTKLVGSNVTNAILRTANGSDHKSIDDFNLFEVMKSAISGANRSSKNNMLEQLLEVINHNFDFCKKVSINMELMQSNTAQNGHIQYCHWYPTAHAHAVGQTLLADIKTDTKSNYGHEFCSAMHAICKK